MISRFVHGLVEDRAMSRDEILDICYLFILGGLDTVTSTLDCSIAISPSIRAPSGPCRSARAHSARRRGTSPPPHAGHAGPPRIAQEHEMHGVTMKPGDTVMVMLGAADTDPRSSIRRTSS